MSRAIIAILRGGVIPAEVTAIAGGAILEAGIDRIEVPLNSPEPLGSIARLAAAYGGDRALIGAGTVLTPPEDVAAVVSVGGKLIVSPDCNPPDVIRATKVAGLTSFPGVMTPPTECFTALRAGADGLKFFPPAELIGPAGLKALRAVLPKGVDTFAVGGAGGPENFADWVAAGGATGFGIGSAVYRPGDSPRRSRPKPPRSSPPMTRQ